MKPTQTNTLVTIRSIRARLEFCGYKLTLSMRNGVDTFTLTHKTRQTSWNFRNMREVECFEQGLLEGLVKR